MDMMGSIMEIHRGSEIRLEAQLDLVEVEGIDLNGVATMTSSSSSILSGADYKAPWRNLTSSSVPTLLILRSTSLL